jgi:hypothetical protein
MATFKALVHEHHKKEDGTYNVKVRVTHKRKSVYNNTIYFVTDKDLTKDFQFKSRKALDIGYGLEKSYYDQANIMGERMNSYSAKELANFLERKVSASSDDTINFIDFGRQYIKDLIKNGQSSYAGKFNRTLNHLVDFFKTENILITDITANNLFLFEEYLKNPHDYVRKDQFGNEVKYHHDGLRNGVIDIMSCVRKLFNAAKLVFNDEDRNDERIKHKPFVKYKVGKPTEETEKRNMLPEDVIKIRDCEGIRPGSRMELGRDVFMLSFYLIAMNTVDLFNATVIKNGRLEWAFRRYVTPYSVAN